MKNILFRIIAILIFSCNKSQITIEKKLTINKEKYINPEKIKNKTLEQVKAKYLPIKEEEFLLNDAIISEFRIELYNIFKEKDKNKPIPIKEVTWEKNKNTNYTIWYTKKSNQWFPIHSLLWDKGSEF